MSRYEKVYLILTTTFCVILVISNSVASKLFAMPGWPELALPVGLLTYPATFLITDLLAEVYGPKRARLTVYLAFAMSFLLLLVVQLSLALPAHPSWAVPGNPYGYQSTEEFQTAYESVFSINGKLLFGSMAAYLVAQLLDVTIFDTLRRWTKGSHLWLRNNVSTLVSQVVDTAIVGSVYLYWGLGMDFMTGLEIMYIAYIYKAIFALCDTPCLYLAVHGIRRYLENDEVVTNERFNQTPA